MKDDIFERKGIMRLGKTFEEKQKEDERQNEILIAFIREVEKLAEKKGVSILTESRVDGYSTVFTIQFTHKDNLPLWMFDVQHHHV